MERKAGSWNLRDRRFYAAAKLKSWMVVFYYRVDDRNLDQFITQLSETLRRMGKRGPLLTSGDYANIVLQPQTGMSTSHDRRSDLGVVVIS